MKLLKMLSEDDKTITFEMDEEDDHEPEYGDVVYCVCEDNTDDEIRLGNLLYDKFGIKTCEIIERGENLNDKNEEDDNNGI